MIELRTVSLRYGAKRILHEVSLRIDEGELVVASGPTGAGKSSLLGVLAGLVPGFTGGELSGDVLIDGDSVIEKSARERVDVVGWVGQDPAAGFVTDTVEEELAYGMEQLGLPPPTMRRRVEETLDLLGIAELRSRDLRTLSGGQQQRVAIGSVLTMHPRLLILDEPTSALDPTGAEDVLATLTRLVHDLGLSVLLAEHRLERVVPFADRMFLLTGDGRVHSGEPELILERSPVGPPIVELGRLAGWRPLPLSVRAARRVAGDLRAGLATAAAVSSVADTITGASAGAVPPTAEVMLAVRDLTASYGRQPALRAVSMSSRAGVVTAVMGRNGSGKSSLLWALHGGTSGLTGVRSASRLAGRVRVGDVDPADLSERQRRERIGLVPQTAADLLYLETVAEECAAADRAAEVPAGATRHLLDSMVTGVADEVHPRDLSEGQRLALVLAIVLVSGPAVLLLDEPTRGLDYSAKGALATVVRRLAADGRVVLVATHDVEFATQVADDIWVLADGEIVSAGPAARVVAESPSFAPQVSKILGPPWLGVAQVAAALAPSAGDSPEAPTAGQVRRT
ncbi:MAG: ABC transporter ATP-binding protein [Nocardioides sp.]